VLYVSQLRKYVSNPSNINQMDDVQVRDNLTVEALPLRIQDREVKNLRGKVTWGGPSSRIGWGNLIQSYFLKVIFEG
jgi:hypothetical protein